MTIRPYRAFLRRTFAVLAVLAATLCFFGGVEARAETRTLKIYFIHTGEKAEITFKRNGRYDKKGLEQLNWFLRDWRRKEPTTMNPKLFDLVWEVYQQVGATDYINVVSAYRSPETNAMLRSTSSGVAKKSQHMLGNAMDFFIPGVPLAKLRATAMKMQRGGVGYYPKSGSPFVHLDVASVRAWPRMSRNQLVALFPEGHTLHLPADGKPLPGYNEALAEYKAKGAVASSQPVQVASADDGDEDERPNLLSMLFGKRDKGSAEPPTPSRPSRQQAQPQQRQAEPAQRPVDILTAAVTFDNLDIPLPLSRPSAGEADLGTPLATALVDPTPTAVETATDPALALAAASVPLPQTRPSALGPEEGVSVADILVSEAADPVTAEPATEVAALQQDDPAFNDDRFGLFDGDVPVPSPRLAYAETGGAAMGVNAAPTPRLALAAVEPAAPVSDAPIDAARTELARKLSAMGETTELAYNEDADFRTLFRPTAARINAAAPVSPQKGGRPGDAMPQTSSNDNITPKLGNNNQVSTEPTQVLVGSKNKAQDSQTVVQYFDSARF